MEWYWILLIIFGGLLLIMASGLPVAFCFLLINIFGAIFLWGGKNGLEQLTFTMWHSLATFLYLPIPMFILLGEVTFRSGMALHAIDAVDKWLGRLPGRLSLLAITMGTIFSTMSGSSVSTTCLLGDVLIPEMERRGYSKVMSIGAIIGGGGLAVIIPPSSMAVVWASIAEVSIGKILISGIIPGIIMAIAYTLYIVLRCWLQPSIAPVYEVSRIPLTKKIESTAKYVLPLSLIVFAVTGLILLGLATPSESAAMGVFASVLLAAAYKKLNLKLVKESLISTLKISTMVFMIMATARAFGQVLATTGAGRGFGTWVTSLPLPPLGIIVGMHLVLLILGCFMSGMPIMLITIPIFMPIIRALGFDPVWFGLTFILNLEIGHTTPPFGIQLFAMKGVAPPGTSMGEIIRASLPFTLSDVAVMFLIIFVPPIATFLPNILMG